MGNIKPKKRTRQFNMLLTPEEFLILQEKADSKGLNISDYIRLTIFHAGN